MGTWGLPRDLITLQREQSNIYELFLIVSRNAILLPSERLQYRIVGITIYLSRSFFMSED